MPPTPLELVRLAADYFGKMGIESARADAEILLAHALGVPRIRLYLDFDKPLQAAEVERYRAMVRRRAQREPTAYIIGQREFWSLPFRVDSRVLVPRPETEILVEVALSKGDTLGAQVRVLDVGVGSGAVALALLSERPSWTAVGVDTSEGALAAAAENGRQLGLEARVEWRLGDLFSAMGAERFGLVVSNPPYVPSDELSSLGPEVARFEPRMALDGGPDGLDAIRRIAAGAPQHLLPGGWLAFEFGSGQEDAAERVLAGVGSYSEIAVRPDYSGNPRVACARWTGARAHRGADVVARRP